MAKLIRQINNLKIKKYTPNDPYYYSNRNKRTYLVESPDGRILEDRLTPSEAINWCKCTKDFTTKRKKQ